MCVFQQTLNWKNRRRHILKQYTTSDCSCKHRKIFFLVACQRLISVPLSSCKLRRDMHRRYALTEVDSSCFASECKCYVAGKLWEYLVCRNVAGLFKKARHALLWWVGDQQCTCTLLSPAATVRLSIGVIQPASFVTRVTHSEALSPSARNTTLQHKTRLPWLDEGLFDRIS